ncbi:MAG: division/cell wall cluster transcriptional repressor MraZ [Bacteroidales bacterium]|nr:division/cell wall cluster transcriptional repressor MraZ [Bacteroidales bacterium]MCF8391563.1 division/cell wall cluster transcriptional repressor MraZ [Bacteroidales bacterium]
MISFIGDYTCKLDSKGRVALPAAFKRQMNQAIDEGFVLKRDVFDKCLILYPMKEWERQNLLIRNRTNPYNKEHNRFLRMFFSGTAEVQADSSNRLLIPKRLMDFAGIGQEAVLAGQYGKIEIWSPDDYEGFTKADDDFASLAEKILGGNWDQTKEE